MTTGRRTIRRYAHELYPHPDEYEVRPLTVEVPYLYAQAIGMDVSGTGWFGVFGTPGHWAMEAGMSRTLRKIEARRTALLADALLQGKTGDDAWEWVESSLDVESSVVYLRAEHYGVEATRIKPYPCGPEPDHHDHYGEPDSGGWRTVTRVDGRESDCPVCTEPVEGAVSS